MKEETKIEIAIFGGLAAFMLYLWLGNQQAGAGTGLESFPAFANAEGTPATPPGPGQFTVGDNPGTSNYTVGGSNIQLGNVPGLAACNQCGSGSSGGGMQFGSTADLVAYLQASGGAPSQSSIADWN